MKTLIKWVEEDQEVANILEEGKMQNQCLWKHKEMNKTILHLRIIQEKVEKEEVITPGDKLIL